MRILHITPTYRPAWRYGGPIYVMHDLCKALVKRGHEVHVFSTDIDGPGFLKVSLKTPVDIDGVKVWYFHSPYFTRINFCPDMKKQIAFMGNDFDLFHIHSVFTWTTAMAGLWAIKNKIPYVLEVHGALMQRFFNVKSSFKKRVWMNLWGEKILKKAAFLRAATGYEKEETQKIYKKESIEVIPHGIDPCSEIRAKQSFRNWPTPYVVFLGRINWGKGLDRLIESMLTVREAYLVIAGNDEDDYATELKRLVEHKGISSKVHFVGAVYGADKVSLLQGACALALTSYSENFGNVVLEAMSEGCPVVVTPEVGLAKTVSDFGCGIVSEGSPEKISEALNQLVHHETLRSEMGQKGRLTVEKYFLSSAVALQMEIAYQKTGRMRHE